ncbi:MAG: hypothetical protein CVV27_12565, partial [Candidatus Melainabacteria bacterium HGW-Melainabacteria-1]
MQKTELPIRRLSPALLAFGVGFGLLLALGLIAVFQPALLENALGRLETGYGNLLEGQTGAHPLLLLVFAFVGGVLGSISPCILAML